MSCSFVYMPTWWHRCRGVRPEFGYVVMPWSDYVPQPFRMDDYSGFYRYARRTFELSVDEQGAEEYPEPKEHCEICRWQQHCEARRRADDHLCLVAGMSALHTTELQRRATQTMSELAAVPMPLTWKPERGSAHAYERLREQARIQVEGRQAGRVFDLEGDPFAGEGGLEYLFGYTFVDDDGALACVADSKNSRGYMVSAEQLALKMRTLRLHGSKQHWSWVILPQ